jgi:hypothetical protein
MGGKRRCCPREPPIHIPASMFPYISRFRKYPWDNQLLAVGLHVPLTCAKPEGKVELVRLYFRPVRWVVCRCGDCDAHIVSRRNVHSVLHSSCEAKDGSNLNRSQEIDVLQLFETGGSLSVIPSDCIGQLHRLRRDREGSGKWKVAKERNSTCPTHTMLMPFPPLALGGLQRLSGECFGLEAL